MRSKKSKLQNNSAEDFLAEYRNMDSNSGYNNSYYNDEPQIHRENPYYEEGRARNKGKKKKKRRKWPIILLILLLLIGTGVVGAYLYVDKQISKFNHIDTGNTNFGIVDSVDKALGDYENIALLGVDARAGEDPNLTRTDAIIVATINKKTGKVALTSIMRDSFLLMKNKSGAEILDKATHAHAFGGPVNTVTMLNKGLDLNIKKFMVLNWNSVADIVDAMGGIEVDVHQNEIRDLNKWGPETAQNTKRKWKPITKTGVQRIDGAQAATYCRIRKTSGGDPGRTGRMRKVIIALIQQAKKHPTYISKMADKVFPEIKTNMKTSDFLKLAPKLLSFDIEKSVGYPSNYWGGIINGKWLAVPTTLVQNAVKLHEQLFDQKNYSPSNQLRQINNKIIQQTNITKGTEVAE